MLHLRRVRLPAIGVPLRSWPFDLPALHDIASIEFRSPVTILVGENGSGKSTLLEALAIAAKAITAGTDDAVADPTLTGVRALADELRLTWSKRPARGFFLRAEDFFGFARRMDALRTGLEAELRRVDVEYAKREAYARDLARAPLLKELGALRDRYGDGLDAWSHGEAFLHFFTARLVPGGMYFLDEPEAPLSPARQLSFLALLKDMEAASSQVVMATHSPILLAYPGADILSFDASPLARVRYEDLEHVTLTRDFLRDPGAFLRHL
ncbi:MAG: AAA family ATPase [Candidatus Limnocylindrales bacterium]